MATQVQATASKRSRKLHHMEIHRSKNGGYHVVHHFGDMIFETPETYSFGPGNSSELLAHMKKHLKFENESTPSDVSE